MIFDQINDERITDRLKELSKQDHILGFLLQGSRVTGFSTPDSDYDIIIYCSDEYYKTLTTSTIIESITEETEGNNKEIGDFVYFSDIVFEQQQTSPMKIDHVPYLESKVLLDKTGKLNYWVETLAKVDETEFEGRLKMQMVQLGITFGNVLINKIREKELDVLVNMNRFLTIAITVWFTYKKTWVPELKWWSDHVKKQGMDKDTLT